MKLYIPTYNRAANKLAGTIMNWPKDLPVFIVTRPEQVDEYADCIERAELREADILPIGGEGIAPTRDNIMQEGGDPHCCMIDDDLQFLIRREDHEWKLRGQTPEEIHEMFQNIAATLEDGFAHVAVSMREGNNRILEPHKDVGRGIRIVAYNRELVNDLGVRFSSEVEGREDLDMTLQLLRRGLPNRIFYRYAQGQRGSNTKGGLEGSACRRDDAMKRSAELLAERHPGFVKAVQKETKSSWGGGTRWDVRIQWKRAFDAADLAQETV